VNEAERNDAASEFLAHFGKKGMHWGVINEDKSSGDGNSAAPKVKMVSKRKAAKREVKAKPHDQMAEKYQNRINIIKSQKTSQNKALQRSRNAEAKALSVERDREKSDALAIREGRMTKRQKNLVIGASIGAGILLAYGAYKFHDSGDMNRMMIKGEEWLTGKPHAWKLNPELAKKMTADDIMKNVVSKINPRFGAYGTKMNCRRCTFAYEMRRRGMDVRATLSNAATGQTNMGLENALSPGANLPTSRFGLLKGYVAEVYALQENPDSATPITNVFMNSSNWGRNRIELTNANPLKAMASWNDIMNITSNPEAVMKMGKSKATSILEHLATQPEGARGELGVGWSMGGGHSVAWEIIGGKPHIFDTQSGEVFKDVASFSKFSENVVEAGFTRLDNLDLNDDFLQRWVQSA
jgi:hypothetical protein